MCKALDDLVNDSKKEGRREGRQEGERLGVQKEKQRIILQMAKNGMDIDAIVNITEMKREDVERMVHNGTYDS